MGDVEAPDPCTVEAKRKANWPLRLREDWQPSTSVGPIGHHERVPFATQAQALASLRVNWPSCRHKETPFRGHRTEDMGIVVAASARRPHPCAEFVPAAPEFPVLEGAYFSVRRLSD